ncbi:GreA/GreB family elongation factor [Vibrio fortis]|uniref:GreA/GreB family elongation factor n=1 Tax=Vibrio fortis TaxID=212667 RepID=UPI00406985DC
MNNIPHISSMGYKRLSDELIDKKKQYESLIVEIREAVERDGSNLTENNGAQLLIQQQTNLEKSIRDLDAFLTTCFKNNTIIDIDSIPEDIDVVRFGTTVKIYDINADTERTYTILGDRESDMKNNIISYVTPVGSALIGSRVGDEVELVTPKGDVLVEVLEICRMK